MAERAGLSVLVCAALALCMTAGCGGSDAAEPAAATQNEPGELGEATTADPEGEEVTSQGGPIGPEPEAAGASGFPSCPDMNVQVTQQTTAKAAKSAVCLVNKLRRRRGRRALKDSAQLRKAATKHAKDMVSKSYFSHTSKNGDGLAERASASGYMRGYLTWRVGENLAWGAGSKSTAKRIVESWMASPPHRRNLLNRRFKEAGLAVVYGAPAKGISGPTGTYAHLFGARGG